MASQYSQGAVTSCLCFPLAKFSYATTSSQSTGPIPWTHMPSQNDLFAVFDDVDIQITDKSVERHQRFKVLQDPQVLENINITILAKEAQEATLQAKKFGHLQSSEFTIIVKNPCVAMRYPVFAEQIRRFQIRFVLQEHFFQTMAMLTRAGVPFSEPTSIPPMTAQTSQYPTMSKIDPALVNAPQTQRQTGLVADGCSAEGQKVQAVSEICTIVRASRPEQSKIAALSLNDINPQIHHNPETEPRRHAAMGQPSSCTNPPASSLPSHSNCSPAIDTYVPRPSTAPLTRPHSLQDSMPPKRDLPFSRKTQKPDGSFANTYKGITALSNETSTLAKDSTSSSVMIQDICGLQQNLSEPSKKRTASKARNGPAKKRKAPTTRKKLAPKNAVNVTPVPTVEELLQQKSTVSHGMGAISESQQGTQNQIDAGNMDCTTIGSQDNFELPLQHAPSGKHTAVTDDQNISRAHPCASVDQSIQAPTPSVPRRNENNGADKPQALIDNNRGMITPTIETGPSSTVAITTISDTTNQHSEQDRALISVSTSKPPLSTRPSSTSTKDLFFADSSNQRLSDFISLSDSHQHKLLQAFIYDSLSDPNFIKLCQTVEGVWTRTMMP